MVADIFDSTLFSSPSYLTVLGDTLYFQSDHVDYGRELWRYDPAAAPIPNLFPWNLFLPVILNGGQQ